MRTSTPAWGSPRLSAGKRRRRRRFGRLRRGEDPSEGSHRERIEMAGKLDGKTIAFLATEGVEQVELTEPWKAVKDAGGTPELISLEPGKVQAFNHLDKADAFPVDHTVAEVDAGSYDALVLPG